MATVLPNNSAKVKEKHPSFGAGRALGLFGMVEVRKERQGRAHGALQRQQRGDAEAREVFKDEGLFTFVRWNTFICNPPLMIDEAQLKEGFAIIDRGLDITTATSSAEALPGMQQEGDFLRARWRRRRQGETALRQEERQRRPRRAL